MNGEGEARDTVTLEERVTSLETQLQDSQRETEELRSTLQRVQADFINYKRRSEQEREDMLKFYNAGLIGKLLPALDELGMALDQAPATEQEDAWTEGVRLVTRKFQAVLESEGATPIEAEGKEFDPREHEALGFRESAQYQEGQVVEVVRPGYSLNGRVLRPAQVIVAKASEADA